MPMRQPRRAWPVPTLAIVLALAGVTAVDAASAPSPAPSASPRASLGSMTSAQVTELAAQVSARVEELRGLRFERPVPVETVDETTARRHFVERERRFEPEDKTRLEERAYAQLGLLPAGYDLDTKLLDMLEEQVAGYYDPQTGRFYVLDHMPRSFASLLMAHELTHALDDQHYGIDRILEGVKDDDDRSAAMGAVVEGSGTLVMSVYMIRELQAGRLDMAALRELQESEAQRTEQLRAAPAFLQRSLLASYLLGQSFLLRGNLAGLAVGVPAADLDHAFASPPVSMEQVLHPEKYWDAARRDLPRAVPVHDVARTIGDGWTLAGHGELGELGLAVLTGLGTVDPSDPGAGIASGWTTPAAAGWGGDAFQHYVRATESPTRTGNAAPALTVLATVWDTAADAEEFEHGLPAVAGRRAWRRGSAVVVVAGDAPERHEAVAQALLADLAPPP